jgi:hypothetical protein
MLKQLTDDQYLHKAVAVATRSGTPNLYVFLWRDSCFALLGDAWLGCWSPPGPVRFPVVGAA